MGEWKSLKIDSGTGWKSIYRDTGSGWKALTWEGVPIDVGDACVDRAALQAGAYTFITRDNPANATGTLTNVCLYMGQVSAADVYVGIFEFISGTTYKCRDAANVGALSAGINNEAVNLTINAGDYIGIWLPNVSTSLEWTTAGESNRYISAVNTCVVDDERAYSTGGAATISLYGTG